MSKHCGFARVAYNFAVRPQSEARETEAGIKQQTDRYVQILIHFTIFVRMEHHHVEVVRLITI